MRFHINVLPTYVPELNGSMAEFFQQVLWQVQLAEELGFDGFWFTEHHFIQYGGAIPNPAVMIAAAAARTSRIRLGSCISILPLHHAIQTAEDYAMADVVSNGRLEFGAGSGNADIDYAVYQVDRAETRPRFEEALDLITSAWRCERFSHQGTFWDVPKVSLQPPPVQRPHPPVWVAGSSAGSLHWAGLRGYNILTVAHPFPPEALRPPVAAWRRGLAEAGHDPTAGRCQLFIRIFVDESRERGRQLARECLARYDHVQITTHRRRPGYVYACDPEYDWAAYEAVGRNIYGNPEEVIAGIERAQANYDFDILSVVFNFGGLQHQDILRSMRLFAQEVAPAFAE